MVFHPELESVWVSPVNLLTRRFKLPLLKYRQGVGHTQMAKLAIKAERIIVRKRHTEPQLNLRVQKSRGGQRSDYVML